MNSQRLLPGVFLTHLGSLAQTLNFTSLLIGIILLYIIYRHNRTYALKKLSYPNMIGRVCYRLHTRIEKVPIKKRHQNKYATTKHAQITQGWSYTF